MAHEKWANAQIAQAIDAGINALDAAEAMRAFLAALPYGADPATYVLPAHRLEQDISAPEMVADARSEWYGRVEPRWARLLDAGEV